MGGLGDATPRRLFLLRHAHPAATPAVGWADTDRPLTRHGRRQAGELGGVLGSAGIELVLCSTALRTRETAEYLGLRAPVRHVAGLYNCEAGRIAFELARLPEYLRAVLVVGHSPGIPTLARDLADHTSDRAAALQLERQYPPATLAELHFRGLWSDLHQARLVRVLRPAVVLE
ncbi:MAG TPA: histidine phosphatase family protein [Propionicimonas sp.]|jgi:phosphohistidine phosphatase|nr:histidine phosphatase family protein [Propionicimonas sp.]